jgi:hypothetical protein
MTYEWRQTKQTTMAEETRSMDVGHGFDPELYSSVFLSEPLPERYP